jgi:hypothetical protein
MQITRFSADLSGADNTGNPNINGFCHELRHRHYIERIDN